MSPGTPVSQPRGFFFDCTPPRDDTECDKEVRLNKSQESGSIHSRPRSRGPDSAESPGPRDWWDTKRVSPDSKATAKPVYSPKAGMPIRPAFEMDLPEHLPGSPLCPKNPLHKSRGNGICVYHGRRRSVNLKTLKRADTNQS